ncbi:S46 family peptidase [Psychroflexus planctonicus]|uniref:Dipeptidyl-peptidase n=1 Tax=Psychroflexus planctonicus TaxID=1526575 RepID=A0ABQ1SFZ9_9FLAO|nr:S46 family peptidase [Psychroflexus planctonicus]GGE37878.1 Asp/Glu-specific dipeptidyl-peptidase [Psychroflexus planctonicus]
MKFIFRLIICFIVFPSFAQQGGMWIPSLLEGMNEEEMTSLGAKITAQDIYDVNNSSLKDAIVHFNGGCTAEVISNQGLLLTNHHCGFGQIQFHSSLENDYLKDGFWAMSLDEELPNKNLYAEFIIKIEDVSAEVLSAINEEMSTKEKQSALDKKRAEIEKNFKKEEWQDLRIKSFYGGNQFFLFVTEKYEDVRLVGAPPSSIGKFGSDTDNWVWPRHTGDFSMFRIYADKNNRPAKYSEDNVPYQPKHFLPISLDGVEEDDFTLVFGFPGRTNEYLPAVAVEQITQKVNPTNIEIREKALEVIDAYMQKDDEIRIQYASKQARIANYWKKWKGENLGIEKSGAIQQKKELEKRFTQAVKNQNKVEEYGDLLSTFETQYEALEPYAVKRSNFLEVFLTNSDVLKIAFRLNQLVGASNQGEAQFVEAQSVIKNMFEGIYKDYNAQLDREVVHQILPLYDADVTEKEIDEVFDNSLFVNSESGLAALDGELKVVVESIQNDLLYQMAKPYIDEFYQDLNPNYQNLKAEVDETQKHYMTAQMEVLPEERYFPDANSTLRVTYGKVNGYQPRDAVYYEPVTYLEGVMEKYVPGDYEFDVPQKLIDLYENKDYGNYADANGKMPVGFIGTNHTTGGNSGSPALDAHGNLIGLNFDRVWEGTMSDLFYDPEICRNIMVDARYILFIIDKYGEASHLIEEMELVHPKAEKNSQKKKNKRKRSKR